MITGSGVVKTSEKEFEMLGSGTPRGSSACSVSLWTHEKYNPGVEGPLGVPGPGPSTQPKRKMG